MLLAEMIQRGAQHAQLSIDGRGFNARIYAAVQICFLRFKAELADIEIFAEMRGHVRAGVSCLLGAGLTGNRGQILV
ncbi:hypothetical protein [Parvibaculum sp.]|uniref:hypothetical protein n=1 Tax=Parvibaculum sp. TaxID=2024848 RepID=UPI0025D96341|nr:hypothetical protein [Parvibaculum sp.]